MWNKPRPHRLTSIRKQAVSNNNYDKCQNFHHKSFTGSFLGGTTVRAETSNPSQILVRETKLSVVAVKDSKYSLEENISVD